MALSAEDIEKTVDAILHGSQERYLQALADAVADRLKQGFFSDFDAEAIELLARDWPAKAAELLAEYAPKIRKDVIENVTDALGKSGAADLDALIRYYGTNYAYAGVSSHFKALSAHTAQSIADIVHRQNLAMSNATEKAWYKVTEDAISQWVYGTKSRDEIVAEAVQELGSSFRVAYESGVTTSIDAAINRTITTEMSKAGGRMTVEACQAWGHELFITDSHFGARPSHAEWQGIPCRLGGAGVVDGVEYPGLEELTGYGTKTGLKGINCKHELTPYFPGITEEPDREFKEEQAIYGCTSAEHYQRTQKQRAYERRIRQTKAEIADLERAGIGLNNSKLVQKCLTLGNQQKQLRNWCRENKLARQYLREKAYAASVQPRALKKKPTA